MFPWIEVFSSCLQKKEGTAHVHWDMGQHDRLVMQVSLFCSIAAPADKGSVIRNYNQLWINWTSDLGQDDTSLFNVTS